MAARTRDIAGYLGAELIGQGGFSAVYRAGDATHGRQVAIKVLEGSLGDAERRRFDRERQTMGRLGSHPNIISVYDSGYTESDEGYIVMELATGGSLGSRLRSRGPVPWLEAVEIMAAIASATQAAHDHGVLHRDIKPDNILIDMFGNPKLSDFGIAAVANNATATMSTTATLAHAAPELLQGQTVTGAVDVYALGSTLCALITGLPPFVRPGDEGVTPMITRALTEPPPDLRPAGIPDAVARVVEQALSKEPAARQRSAAEVAAELRAIAAGGGSAHPSGSAYPSAPTMPAYGTPPVVPAPPAPPTMSQPAPAPPPGAWAPPPGVTIQSGPLPGGYSNDPSPPAGFAPQGFSGLPAPPHGFANTGGGPVTTGPAPYQAPYQTLYQAPYQAPFQAPAKSAGSGGRTVLFLLAGVTAIMLLGIVAVVVNQGDDTDTAAGDTATESSTTTSASTTTPSTDSPAATIATVSIDCPSEVPVGVRTFCTIYSTEAVEGEWSLPGFLTAPEPIEVLNEGYPVFIEPTNGDAVGSTFTITATVVDAAGMETEAEHSFVVTGPTVTINCPDTIALNSTAVCDIVSTDAVAGDWNIPNFGGDALEVVPGSNPISIEPSAADAVGVTFTITATVEDANGATVTAGKDFTVVAAG